MSFVVKTAARFLFSKNKEKAVSVIGLFSLAGIALGVATLVVVMAVMNGFRIEITSKILGLNGHAHIRSVIGGQFAEDAPVAEDARRALKEAGIQGHIIPVIDGQAMILNGDNARGVAVKAPAPEDVAKFGLIAQSLSKESISVFTEERFSVLLGVHLAASLGVRQGDDITLISPRVNSSAIGTLPRMKTFLVAGTFASGMYEYDSNMLLMRLQDAQAFFRYPGEVTRLEAHLEKEADSAAAMSALNKELSGGYYEALGWERMHAGLFSALQVERSVMFLILSLIVCVAAFNIVSGLMILVRDKNYDIAILKTMGLSRGAVTGIFFLCGAALGVTGTAIGVILGAVFAVNVEAIRALLEKLTGTALFDPVIYFLSELPSDLEAENVFAAAAVGLFCSCAATLYPAWKASGRQPAEALRTD